jgi:hypothetical protein
MIRWFRIVAKALLVAASVLFAVIFAARATEAKRKAKELTSDKEHDLVKAINQGTLADKKAAQEALDLLKEARAHEQKAQAIITRGASHDSTVQDVLDRWRRPPG